MRISAEMKFLKETLVCFNPKRPIALQPKHFILVAVLVSVLPFKRNESPEEVVLK